LDYIVKLYKRGKIKDIIITKVFMDSLGIKFKYTSDVDEIQLYDPDRRYLNTYCYQSENDGYKLFTSKGAISD